MTMIRREMVEQMREVVTLALTEQDCQSATGILYHLDGEDLLGMANAMLGAIVGMLGAVSSVMRIDQAALWQRTCELLALEDIGGES